VTSGDGVGCKETVANEERRYRKQIAVPRSSRMDHAQISVPAGTLVRMRVSGRMPERQALNTAFNS
jgi:hypothetical protein